MRSIVYMELGRISYQDALTTQRTYFNQVLKAKSAGHTQSHPLEPENYLLFCEHEPVYTMGKSGSASNIIVEKGLDLSNVVKTDRGGDITFHGPGQIVGYPILDLEQFGIGLKRYIYLLEEVVITFLQDYDLKASRLAGANGVWLDSDHPLKARKICAIGVKCSRYVTMHGFAFNINTDLSHFEKIIPCGIQNKSVTSLQQETNSPVDFGEAMIQLKNHFLVIFKTGTS